MEPRILKIKYNLSTEARKQGFINTGNILPEQHQITAPADKLSREGRAMWAEMYGYNAVEATAYKYQVSTPVFSNGEPAYNPPQIETTTRYATDKIFADNEFETLLRIIYAGYKQAADQLPAAQAAYEAAGARKQAEEAQRQAQTQPTEKKWVNILKNKIEQPIKIAVADEKKRFMEKFELCDSEIIIDTTNTAPYINLKCRVPVTLNAIEQRLHIYNYNPFADAENTEEKFDDISEKIADALAEYFDGEKQAIYSYNKQKKFLLVKTGSDIISVASIDCSDC